MPPAIARFDNLVVLHPEVAEALAAGRAVVALESTLIAHGLPWPQNLETALALEAILRAEGAVPATIAVLDGRIRIGLDAGALDRLAGGSAAGGAGGRIAKLSRRDLPVVLAAGGDGATTVAATMICARLAGIAVFATGGIGGVHRGAETSFDISADLEELARTPVAVVCAGAKAILDLPKTLEYLEMRGVPVIGYGTGDFPAFYCRESGLPLDQRCDTPEAVAAVLRLQAALGYPGGTVIANPIPTADALPRDRIEAAVARALGEAAARGLRGKAVTPFLLARLVELTGGAALTANIALAMNNARLAARIARTLAAGSAG